MTSISDEILNLQLHLQCVGKLLEISAASELNLIPPAKLQQNARRALEVRSQLPPSRRGGTEVGLARARDLSNGKQLSIDTVKRMLAYFQRHQVDRPSGEDWSNLSDPPEKWSKGRIAWGLWGGDNAIEGKDSGWNWAKEISRKS